MIFKCFPYTRDERKEVEAINVLFGIVRGRFVVVNARKDLNERAKDMKGALTSE